MKKKILFILLIILNINVVYAKETLVDYITNLYADAEKNVVTANAYYDMNVGKNTKIINYNYAPSVNLMNDRLGNESVDLDGGNIRYYGRTPNNYIDIGDKYETDYTYIYGNKIHEKIGNLFRFDTVEECYDFYASSLGQTLYEYYQLNGINTADQFCATVTIPKGTPILWRIIGVFDGKLRLMRDESIGYLTWDSSSRTDGKKVNNGFGVNEWSQADLMKLLNPGYDDNRDEICTVNYLLFNSSYSCLENNDKVNNSLYWNSKKGTCYTDYRDITNNCDFRSIGLSETAKQYIVDQTIYLGTLDVEIVYPNQSYLFEKSDNKYDPNIGCYHLDRCNDNIPRNSVWTGKVGLIYPSDFGYASDLSTCWGDFYSYSSDYGTCALTNWMFSGRYRDNYTIMPVKDDASGIYMIHDMQTEGDEYGISLYYHDEYHTGTIRPTITIDPSLVRKSGEGTKDDPYVIGKEDKYRATINYYGEDGKLLNIDNNPRILNDLTSGYTEVIKSPKVSGCYAKDVKISITDKDEVYDVYYNCSVIVNPKTGRLLIILGVILGILSIGYLVYYVRNRKDV